ncbi:MAG: hypothetical protein GY866_10580 [Proteobacteria bacterium]|nr:hypothetical protein [Pseudomonadota bacterium]
MDSSFRKIPDHAFGTKPLLIIRDIEAVLHNYRLFKEKADATGSVCGVVLKADVHGLLMKDVAPALYGEGARHFFIEELIEGVELREILPGEDARIYAMAGLLDNEEKYFHGYDLIPCLNCLEQLRRWNGYWESRGKGRAVLHLDTHMNRLGLLDDEVEILSRNFEGLSANLEIPFYMSHFYDIKGTDPTNCFRQLDVLNKYLERLPPAPLSFACTDSVILLDNRIFNFQMIRPGIGLVGGAPNAGNPISPEARHTMEIYTRISQIKRVKKGRTIGYGGSYTTKRDTRMALAHIGYKDGYLRSLSELDSDSKGVYMVLGGYRTPLMGKISLGAATIDVTDVPDGVLERYKYAEVIGPNVDIKELADKAGCYEILAALGRPNKKAANYTLQEFENLSGTDPLDFGIRV